MSSSKVENGVPVFLSGEPFESKAARHQISPQPVPQRVGGLISPQ